MNEISCDVCMDLVPLVRDGIASEGSRQAVKCHLEGCDRCLALWEENPLLYEENTLPIPDGEKALEKFRLQRACQRPGQCVCIPDDCWRG